MLKGASFTCQNALESGTLVFSGARHVKSWSLKLHFNYACSTDPIYMIFGILQVQTPENTLPKFEYI